MPSTLCHPAVKTKPIPTCIGELSIGTIASPSTNVVVHLLDITTGRELQFQTISDNAGLVKVDLSDTDFSDRHSYEAWITPANSQVKETITLGSKSGTVIAVNFALSFEGGEVVSAPTVTLEEE